MGLLSTLEARVDERQLAETLRKELDREIGLDADAKVCVLRRLASELDEQARHAGPRAGPIRVVPSRPGAFTADEGHREGAGVSEFGGLLDSTGTPSDPDQVLLLYELDFRHASLAGADPDDVEIELALAFVMPDGSAVPVPGVRPRSIRPMRVDPQPLPGVSLAPTSLDRRPGARYVASFVPQHDLLPIERGGRHWSWEDAPPALTRLAADGSDPFTLGNRFHQRVRADLVARCREEEVGRDTVELEVFDLGRFGSLYDRLLERLLPADLERQQARLPGEELTLSIHPWFPVLVIGSEKARLYTKEIRSALELQRRSPVDPGWLLRVGLYLELLTCLGIAEVVRDSDPDLLTPEERELIEHASEYEPIRSRLNVEGWRRVWKLREIVAPRSELSRAGSVDLLNLRRKQDATLEFLHVHHEDLKGAIELAGPNPLNSQETWHRVFRDAERAVLGSAGSVFPELLQLSERARRLALWSQLGGRFLDSIGPRWVTELLRQIDGIYPSASRKYRASMNEVAEWARARGLMDYTGEECISERASLIEASLAGDHAHVAALHRRDGARQDAVSGSAAAANPVELDPERVVEVLRGQPVFQSLTEKERHQVARGARLLTFGPDERVVVQGQAGESLFVILDGEAEVLIRDENGRDRLGDLMGIGAVFGEAALLTGAPRNATVRATTTLSLYEVHKSSLVPILERRPSLAIDLGLLCARRLARRGDDSQTDARDTSSRFARRIREFLSS